MARTKKREDEQPNPEELIPAFSRCRNYPRNDLEFISLAQGLRRASDKTGVLMQRIVDACLEISEWCPTDADMLTVALGMRAAKSSYAPLSISMECAQHPVPIAHVVPMLPDGRPDHVEWTIQCMRTAWHSKQHPMPGESQYAKDSRRTWLEACTEYRVKFPEAWIDVKMGREPSRKQLGEQIQVLLPKRVPGFKRLADMGQR